MQVKAHRFTAEFAEWDIEYTRLCIESHGKATLNAWAKSNYGLGFSQALQAQMGQSIQLESTDFGERTGMPTIKRWNGLAMLGGRQSIVDWLRLQGNEPEIRNPVGSHDLFVYMARKHRTVHKDLTIVLVAPRRDLVIRRGSWEVSDPVNLHRMPEAEMGEITPRGLGTLVQRLLRETRMAA